MLVLGRHAVWPLFQGETQRLQLGGYDVTLPLLNGWIGVDLFFVLSGFLIAHHLLRKGADTPLANFGRYIGARALRIVPAYVAVMAIVVVGAIPLYEVAPKFLSFRILYHLLFLQDYLPANIVVAFWSLGVEEKFYLLAPFVLLLALRTPSVFWRYGFLASLILLPMLLRGVTAFQHPEVTSYPAYFPLFRSPFHLTFDGLAVGVFCAFLKRDVKDPERLRTLVRLIFWAGGLALLLQLFGWELLGEVGGYQKVFQPLVLSITFGALVLAAVMGGAPKRILGSRLLLIIARISYPLYLIHIPLVPLSLALSGYEAGQDMTPFLQYVAVFLALSFVAAFALHYLIEKPFLLMKDRWSRQGDEEIKVGAPLNSAGWQGPLIRQETLQR